MSHLDIETPLFENKPHIWIQWKGTDVCCDINCICGYCGHYDGEFFYFFRCPGCGQAYECGTHVNIYPVDEVPDGCLPVLLEDDDEDDNDTEKEDLL